MDYDIFTERRRALEEGFFRQYNQALLDRMRAEVEREHAIAALGEQTGVTDPRVLGELLDQGLSVATLAAAWLAPIVAVAWADGRLEGPERELILKDATEAGLVEGTAGRVLLESWLVAPPEEDLFRAWEDYVRELVPRLGPEAREVMERRTLERARAVAEATGGYFGLGDRISREEHAVIARIEAAFRG